MPAAALLTYDQAAEIVRECAPAAEGVGPRTIKGWCQAGYLHRSKVGRSMMVLRSEIEELLRGERGPWQSG